MKIVLLGYMCSGKTAVGEVLAKALDLEFIDLDHSIEKATGSTIPEIFEKKGELFFRKKEMEVLESILDKNTGMVLSLGGGTPCYGNNMHLIKEHTPYAFYLKWSIGSLAERILSGKTRRPLVANIPDDQLPEFIGKHLFERAPFYAMANFTIEGNDKSLEQISEEIQSLL